MSTAQETTDSQQDRRARLIDFLDGSQERREARRARITEIFQEHRDILRGAYETLRETLGESALDEVIGMLLDVVSLDAVEDLRAQRLDEALGWKGIERKDLRDALEALDGPVIRGLFLGQRILVAIRAARPRRARLFGRFSTDGPFRLPGPVAQPLEEVEEFTDAGPTVIEVPADPEPPAAPEVVQNSTGSADPPRKPGQTFPEMRPTGSLQAALRRTLHGFTDAGKVTDRLKKITEGDRKITGRKPDPDPADLPPAPSGLPVSPTLLPVDDDGGES